MSFPCSECVKNSDCSAPEPVCNLNTNTCEGKTYFLLKKALLAYFFKVQQDILDQLELQFVSSPTVPYLKKTTITSWSNIYKFEKIGQPKIEVVELSILPKIILNFSILCTPFQI